MFTKISTKILIIITAMVIFSTGLLGFISYEFAKAQLIKAGKLDLEHILDNSVSTLSLLNEQVVKGNLTMDEAKEKARVILDGPKQNINGKTTYDFSKSTFLYKKEGYLFAYDSKNVTQMHPINPLFVDKTDVKNTDGKYIIKDLVSAAKKENVEKRFYSYAWENVGETTQRQKIAYMMYFKPWDWNIGIGAYETEFYDSLTQLKYWVFGISFIIIIISLLAFYLVTRSRFAHLKIVTDTSLEIAKGTIKISNIPESKDEIGQLGSSYNKMTRLLKNLIESIANISKNVSYSTSDLTALSEETTSTSSEIEKAMEEIARGSAEQASELESTNLMAKSLVDAIELMNKQKDEMNTLSVSSEKAVQEGQKKVIFLRNSNDMSSSASEQIRNNISNLAQRTREVSNIVSTIDTISKQTNLLALNASIEAARAGEHGKGFAVVADEVKKLANETNQATAIIQNMINGIEKEMDLTVQTMNNSANMSSQLQEAVEGTEKEFDVISQSSTKMTGALNTLDEQINTVTKYSNTIIESIRNIAFVAEKTAAATEQISASTIEQTKAVSTLTDAANNLNIMCDNLDNLVKNFSLE